MEGLSIADMAYAAGVIDGEGSLGSYLRRGGTGVQLRLVVSNTDERLVLWFQQRFGGHITVRKANRIKPVYQWRVNVRAGREIIRALLPFLVVKREQAEVWLELAALQDRRPLRIPEEEIERRVLLYGELREMKRRAV